LLLAIKKHNLEQNIIDYLFLLKEKCVKAEEEIGTGTGLSYREIIGVSILNKGEKIDSNTLSSRMGLSASRGSRIIDKLIAKGFFSRRTADHDRRAVEIALTAKGNFLKKRIETIKEKCEKKIESGINNKQKKIIKEGLKMLNEVL